MIVICQNESCRHPLDLPEVPAGSPAACPQCRQSFRVDVPAAPEGNPPAGAGAEFVIYDLETTGLSPDYEEIIQLAAMRFRNGTMVPAETFFSYARPERRISAFITAYTGITNADVHSAPRPPEVLQEFSRFVGRSRLIAHNGRRFDSKFLTATCRRHQLDSTEIPSIDSIYFSKRLFGTARGTGHGLDRVLDRLGLSAAGHRRHDARADVELLGRAVERMWSRLGLDSGCTGIPTHTAHLPTAR